MLFDEPWAVMITKENIGHCEPVFERLAMTALFYIFYSSGDKIWPIPEQSAKICLLPQKNIENRG